MRAGRFFERLAEPASALRCAACPQACVIRPGSAGICGVRANREGELVLPYYGLASAISPDPVEKKPLYHYYPGSLAYSIGFFGCNLRCPFCQNFHISQRLPEEPGASARGGERETVEPEALVREALESGAKSIALTYSEPLVHPEYVLDAAKAARDHGLKTILVTNGYSSPQVTAELARSIDAANVDLKAWDQGFYRRELGGERDRVLEFIEALAPTVHLELTSLIVPGKNDSPEDIAAMAEWIAKIDRRMPLHLSRYFPRYKYEIPATDLGELARLAALARESLDYVYQGNAEAGSDTRCPKCGATLVMRKGYRVRIGGLVPSEDGMSSRCASCGEEIPIVLGNGKP
jgi:pyruvate formate lyase activating enzyme